jgi:RRXRR protein
MTTGSNLMACSERSKFQTLGIQMPVETRREVPMTTMGVDPGAKYEGYAVVCGHENVLAVKLDLPDKHSIVRKLLKRQRRRRARWFRKCRRRQARFRNRKRQGEIHRPAEVGLHAVHDSERRRRSCRWWYGQFPRLSAYV